MKHDSVVITLERKPPDPFADTYTVELNFDGDRQLHCGCRLVPTGRGTAEFLSVAEQSLATIDLSNPDVKRWLGL